MKVRIVAVVVLMLASACVYLMLRARDTSSETPFESFAQPQPAQGPELRDVPGASVREHTSSDYLRVRSGDGAPIRNAVVSWTPLATSSALAELESTEAMIARTVTVATDDDGSVLLWPTSLARDVRAAMWVSAEAHVARGWIVEPGAQAGIARELELQPARDWNARVLENGTPTNSEATVLQWIEKPPAKEITAECPLEVWRAFARTTPCGDDGRARLHPHGGFAGMLARKDTLRSTEWFGRQPFDVQLELHASFQLAGRVRIDSAGATPREVTIEVSRNLNAGLQPIGRCAVREDGSFGPSLVPLPPADHLVVMCTGTDLTPASQRVPTPEPGALVTLSFDLKAGRAFSVRTVDPDGAPIADARADLIWLSDGEWLMTSAWTKADGVARLHGGPEGQAWYRASRSGFVGPTRETYLVAGQSMPLELTLDRAGKLLGRCVHEGKPVESFVLKWWSKGIDDLQRKLFVDAKDGRFELDLVPLGDLSIFASSEEHPRSPTHFLHVLSDAPQEIVLELASGIAGSARVIDAATLEPIAGAEVRVWEVEQERFVDAQGPLHRTDARGHVVLAGLVQGRNGLEVQAAGFARHVARATSTESTPLDFGTIALHRVRSIDVRLELNEGDDATHFWAEIKGPQVVPPHRFDALGRITFNDLQRDFYSVTLLTPEGGTLKVRHMLSRTVTPVVFHWSTRTPLQVRVISDSESADELQHCWLIAAGATDDGEGTSYEVPLDGRDSVDLSRVPIDDMTVHLFDASGVSRDAVRFSRRSSTTNEIVLRLSRELRTLRVVDRDREPIEGAGIIVFDRAMQGSWGYGYTTNAAGELKHGRHTEERAHIYVTHATRGTVVLADFDLSRERTPDLVLDAPASLDLLLADHEQPLEGIAVQLGDGLNLDYFFVDLTSDAEGRVRSAKLGAQTWTVRIDDPMVWPLKMQVEARSPAATQTIQVRRRGSVELSVKRGGLPLRGQRIELHSLEFASSVRDWVQRDLVTSSSASMETDDAGNLRFDGLPHGPYRWSASASGRDVVSGELTVLPRIARELTISIE